MKFFVAKITPLVLWCVLIFYFSSLPVQPVLDPEKLGLYNILFRKFLHVFEFSVLYVLWYRLFLEMKPSKLTVYYNSAAFPAVLFSLFYAIFDEWHQTFTPGREGKAIDVIADLCGILLALILCECLRRCSAKSLFLRRLTPH